MITGLSLENLKCYKALSLAVSPLTLLTGFNAGGKSTAIQGALLISQALRANTRSRWLSLNGPLAELGTPGEVINKAARDRWISIGIASKGLDIKWKFDTEERSETDALPISEIELVSSKGLISSHVAKTELTDLLPDPWKADREIAGLIETLRTLIFLSAIREGPREVFASPQSSRPIHADVGTKGELATWWFEKYSDEDVETGRQFPSETGTTLRRQVGAWGSELFPGLEATAQSLQKTGLVQLQLRTQITDDWRRPSNVGYELSYAFPILVSGLLAKSGQCLFIDSPEAHLHPKAQSRMGIFLAMVASTGVRVIVETHSDHVLNGARLAVRQSVIKSHDVAVHFFAGPSEKGNGIISLRMDEAGAIKSWPEGFFDQSERDLARLAGWE